MKVRIFSPATIILVPAVTVDWIWTHNSGGAAAEAVRKNGELHNYSLADHIRPPPL